MNRVSCEVEVGILIAEKYDSFHVLDANIINLKGIIRVVL